jgi:hypothetical protein
LPLSLEWFWLSAHTEYCVFPYDQFITIPKEDRRICLATGLLREGPVSRTVECDACQEGHVEEVIQMDYPDGKRRFFIPCPECFTVEVNPKRLRQWFPNYGEIAELLYQSLNCRGLVKEIVPNSLWNIGQAPLAGQSHPIWLARSLTKEIAPFLPQGKLPLLFVIAPIHYENAFDPDRTFEMSSLVTLKGSQLNLDVESIRHQPGPVENTSQIVSQHFRKDVRRASAIQAAKRELHNHILSMKSLLVNTNERLPRLTQKELACRLGESESMISRILNENTDEILTILWKTANNENLIRWYNRKLNSPE